jgi:hypothetical protein
MDSSVRQYETVIPTPLESLTLSAPDLLIQEKRNSKAAKLFIKKSEKINLAVPEKYTVTVDLR